MTDNCAIKLTDEQEKVIVHLDYLFNLDEDRNNVLIKKADGVGATRAVLKYITDRIKYRTPFHVLLITRDEAAFRFLAVALDHYTIDKVDYQKEKVNYYQKGIIQLMNGNAIRWQKEFKEEYKHYELIFDDNERERAEDYYRFSDYYPCLSPGGVVVLTDEIESGNVYEPSRLTVLEMKKKIKRVSIPVEDIGESTTERADKDTHECKEGERNCENRAGILPDFQKEYAGEKEEAKEDCEDEELIRDGCKRQEERAQGAIGEMEQEKDEKIREVTSGMYDNVIEETRRRLVAETNPDGTRKYSDREVSERIATLRRAQNDARNRHDTPKGLNECLGGDHSATKRDHFRACLPLFDDRRDYGALVRTAHCDYRKKELHICLGEFENDVYYPELIREWIDTLNGEMKTINITIEQLNSFGKVLYEAEYVNCHLDNVSDDGFSQDNLGLRTYYLTYSYDKVVFNEGTEVKKNARYAVSVDTADGGKQDQSKLVNSRNFERAQELCSAEGQKVLDRMARLDLPNWSEEALFMSKRGRNSYSKIKKDIKCAK